MTQTPSKLEIENVLKKEEGRILGKISDSDFVITLEILGFARYTKNVPAKREQKTSLTWSMPQKKAFCVLN